jgi:hypothetical protein
MFAGATSDNMLAGTKHSGRWKRLDLENARESSGFLSCAVRAPDSLLLSRIIAVAFRRELRTRRARAHAGQTYRAPRNFSISDSGMNVTITLAFGLPRRTRYMSHKAKAHGALLFCTGHLLLISLSMPPGEKGSSGDVGSRQNQYEQPVT